MILKYSLNTIKNKFTKITSSENEKELLILEDQLIYKPNYEYFANITESNEKFIINEENEDKETVHDSEEEKFQNLSQL